MTERSQSSERIFKERVRVVYHAEGRTFARLFNERSLDEVKDVVRRKLGLGQEADVSLKQMRYDSLVDLEDDDDFQAFRVLLRTSISVDIQVTVGRLRDSAAPPPVSTNPRKRPSASKTTVLSSASLSRQPVRSVASGDSNAHPEALQTTQASVTGVKTSDPSAGKRKMLFDGVAPAASDKPRTSKKVTTLSSIVPAEAAESPATPKPVDAEGPPKKKQKKAAAKAKDVQPTEVVQSSLAKAPDAPKLKPKKSAALDHGKHKNDDGAGSERSPAHMGQPNQLDKSVNDAYLQPGNVGGSRIRDVGSDRFKWISAEDSASKTRKSENAKVPPQGKFRVSIPQTSASTNVRSEVAAAILFGCMSKPSETVPSEPPAKGKSVKKDTKMSSTSSIASPVDSTSVLVAPAYETPNVPTECRPERVIQINGPPPQTSELNSSLCPICLEEPFHIRYYCPTVLKGPGVIRNRLEELKRMNMGDQQSLIKELEGLLRDPEVTSKHSYTALTDGVQSREASPLPHTPLPRTPTVPSGSCVSEITVENRDEGGSSESSDGVLEGGVRHQGLSAPRRHQTPKKQFSATNDDLEAVIRGPVSKHKSILHVIDRIAGDNGSEGTDSEDDEAELEEDPDEQIDRSRCRLSRHVERSSDSESEDEESPSPSPLHPAEGTSDNMQPSIQGSHNPTEEFAKPQNGGVIMGDSVDPLVFKRQDGDSEEIHMESEDRMDVDHVLTGGKRAVTIVGQQTSFPPPRDFVLLPSDGSSNVLQQSEQPNTDPTSNGDDDVLAVSEAHNEVEADPIEPADDLQSSSVSRSSDADPIEAPFEVIGSLFTGVTQSTPKPGVVKRMKVHNGQISNDEAEHNVFLEQPASEATDEVTLLPAKGKSQRKTTEMPTAREPTQMRKSPRLSSLPPSTSTPAAVAVLNHRSKVGARIRVAAKMPAKRSEERPGALQSNARGDAAHNESQVAPTPSLIRWETLTEPSSPSLQLDETLVCIDELMSSSPQSDNIHEGRSRERAPSQVERSRRNEQLFDQSSSRTPFPYPQHQNDPTPKAATNEKEREGITDSEEEPKGSEKKAELSLRYRSLSHLASQAATLFSPSLSTPANTSMTDGNTKKRAIYEDSSSSSSDTEEINGSDHIPQGRRAGSALERKKGSLLSRM